MPVYTLQCDRHKVAYQLMSNDDIPADVDLISYHDMLFTRSTQSKADGKPDPYLWIHLEETPPEGARVIDGKALISETTHNRTSAQRRGLNVDESAGKRAELEDAIADKRAVVEAQATLAERVAELEAQLADKRAELEDAIADKRAVVEAQATLAERVAELEAQLAAKSAE